MKLTTLIEMMEKPEYKALSCADFAQIVRRSGVLEEVTKDVKATVETIQSYMNDAILEQSENGRRMKLKDTGERYAVYSDMEER